MARMIHARLDDQTEKLVVEIERRLGWNVSQVVRERIKALDASLSPQTRAKARRRIVGLGRFQSGKPDLGSNKKHLEDFGS